MAPMYRLSLKEWQAQRDLERARGLPRESLKPKTPPRTVEKITEPLAQNEHYKRNRGSLTAEGGSACFDELKYSQSAGGVYASFAKGGTWFYPMSRADAEQWFQNDQGVWFNKMVR